VSIEKENGKIFDLDSDGVFEVVDPSILSAVAGGSLTDPNQGPGDPNVACINVGSCTGGNALCQIK